MNEDKKAKLLLLGENVIEIDNLYQFFVSKLSYQLRNDLRTFDNSFYFPEPGKEIMTVDMSLTALIEANDYIKINKAKKVRVILLDEFNNIIN